MPAPNKLNWKLLKRTIRQTKPYWFSEERRSARWLLFGLALLLLANTYTDVLFNDRSGEFTSALAEKDGPRFWHAMGQFFLILVAGVPIYAYYYYVKDKLAINWRRWLTGRFVDRYLNNRGYYRLTNQPEVDNPDQRISEDIDAFTYQSLTFVLLLANSALQLVAFGAVLWSISTLLVGVLVLYAVFATGLTFGLFGEKLVGLNTQQRKREADYRFGLIRLRENAESIALYHGEEFEKSHLERVFGRLYANRNETIRWTLRLHFFYYSNSFLTMALPTLVIAPRVLSGELEVGRIVQATGAFTAILSALTLMLDNITDLSRFAASVGRLDTLVQSLSGAEPKRIPWYQRRLLGRQWLQRIKGLREAIHGNPDISAEELVLESRSKIATQLEPILEFDGVTLYTPNYERILVKDLSFAVPKGKSLMIVGPSGLGKSSLLRAAAGLWNSGQGVLKRPGDDDMLFLPQAPYMVVGSLRLQLNYPNLNRSVNNAELQQALDSVNLGDLTERCGGFDKEFDFEKILSTGERQRLAFARVLLKRPRYVLLDEATSALDSENEALLYGCLVKTETTFISISHRPQLMQYHQQVLELAPGGAWSVYPAEKVADEIAA